LDAVRQVRVSAVEHLAEHVVEELAGAAEDQCRFWWFVVPVMALQ
jgi:hypothetical protein